MQTQAKGNLRYTVGPATPAQETVKNLTMLNLSGQGGGTALPRYGVQEVESFLF